ncbi:class I SAM-dependent methyltransferase [Streptomyces sp. NBC_01268]|uniref:class I SAM-dependent methyltransferase n=1 Tax=unclassified Streptomyces TaxID=2593676 RepID=UPI002E3322DD|nr:class I SAM-dependent methyltransferase [Streptomyces sp. NBC_01268]
MPDERPQTRAAPTVPRPQAGHHTGPAPWNFPMTVEMEWESPMSSISTPETAADLAAVATLLEMADRLGIVPLLERGDPVTAAELAVAADVPEEGMAGFLATLVAAALLVPTGVKEFRVADDFADRIHQSGYLTWSLRANQPYVQHPAEFLRDPAAAAAQYSRDGREVAVSSRWIGSQGFYPAATEVILGARPKRIVDLGAGAAGLLIDLLGRLPESTGVALDMSAGACREASRAALAAGVGERLTVVERPIQSIADDPGPVAGADVIHAGFVFHDIVQEGDVFDRVLRQCREALRPGGIMAITDAVPYASAERERRFSALFTYLHAGFMNVTLPPEEDWLARFRQAGFEQAECVPHRFPGGRLFIATK